jgi:hypothetical protein
LPSGRQARPSRGTSRHPPPISASSQTMVSLEEVKLILPKKALHISASQETGPDPGLTCANRFLRCACPFPLGCGRRHQNLILTCGYTLLRWSVRISGNRCPAAASPRPEPGISAAAASWRPSRLTCFRPAVLAVVSSCSPGTAARRRRSALYGRARSQGSSSFRPLGG